MKVDSTVIKNERLKRAWSQEHLAQVSGLGRRTVQRIESLGIASLESVQAISAVLDIPVDKLVIQEIAKNSGKNWRLLLSRRLVASLSIVGVLITLFLARSVVAQQLLLDVSTIVNEDHQNRAKVMVVEGEELVLDMEEGYRLIILPNYQANSEVRLAVQLLKLEGDEYKQIAQPTVVTQDNQQAMIRNGSVDGDLVDIYITPSKQN